MPKNEPEPNRSSVVAPTRYATFTNRYRALLIDTALVFGAFIIVLLASELADEVPGSGRAAWGLLVGLFLLYEPLFIWRRGATIGHAVKHLRVVTTATGKPPGFARALARYLLKVILGPPSFVTMALSRRHQAVHDLLTRTTVQLSSAADVSVADYHLERVEPADVELPSRWRRLIAITIYLGALFIGYAVVLLAIDTDGCAETQSCTGSLRIVVRGLALLWLGLSIGAVVAGWKGLLFGARRIKRAAPDSFVA